MKQTRTQAREEAFKLVFQLDMHKDEIDFLIDNLLAEKPESERNIEYIKTVVNGVAQKSDELEELIEGSLTKGWKLSRLSRVSISVLKLAIFEMKYIDDKDVPCSVAINEAVELTKKYDEPEKAPFVNGILGTIYKKIKAQA